MQELQHRIVGRQQAEQPLEEERQFPAAAQSSAAGSSSDDSNISSAEGGERGPEHSSQQPAHVSAGTAAATSPPAPPAATEHGVENAGVLLATLPLAAEHTAAALAALTPGSVALSDADASASGQASVSPAAAASTHAGAVLPAAAAAAAATAGTAVASPPDLDVTTAAPAALTSSVSSFGSGGSRTSPYSVPAAVSPGDELMLPSALQLSCTQASRDQPGLDRSAINSPDSTSESDGGSDCSAQQLAGAVAVSGLELAATAAAVAAQCVADAAGEPAAAAAAAMDEEAVGICQAVPSLESPASPTDSMAVGTGTAAGVHEPLEEQQQQQQGFTGCDLDSSSTAAGPEALPGLQVELSPTSTTSCSSSSSAAASPGVQLMLTVAMEDVQVAQGMPLYLHLQPESVSLSASSRADSGRASVEDDVSAGECVCLGRFALGVLSRRHCRLQAYPPQYEVMTASKARYHQCHVLHLACLIVAPVVRPI